MSLFPKNEKFQKICKNLVAIRPLKRYSNRSAFQRENAAKFYAKENATMNARTKAFPRIVSLTMAIAMALTMVVSAYAAVQPYNADATAVTGKFLATSSSYTATVVGPTGTPKTKLEMMLYEKGLFGYKKVDSASASANSNICSKTVRYDFKDNKQYKLTVAGSAYVNGSWDTVTKNFTASF